MQLFQIMKERGNARVEISNYDGTLKVENLIDWIGEVETYFDYEKIEDPIGEVFYHQVEGACNFMVGLCSKDRVDNHKEKIRTWKKMVSKMKDKFLPCGLSTSFVQTGP
jgi:hypothetical protein